MGVDYLLTCSQPTLTSPTPRETASSDRWIRFEASKRPLNLIASTIECEVARKNNGKIQIEIETNGC